MKCSMLITLVILLGSASCMTFHGIEPINPKAGNPSVPHQVDSLQPILRWKPSPNPGATYDVVIYEELVVSVAPLNRQSQAGRVIYLRQNLTTSEHKVEEVLDPNSRYYWSVRERNNGAVSNWSKYDYSAYYCLSADYYRNSLFTFKTPGK